MNWISITTLVFASCVLSGCGDAAAQTKKQDRSEQLREEVAGKSPLKLADYQAAESARAKQLDERIARLESELKEATRLLREIDARLQEK